MKIIFRILFFLIAVTCSAQIFYMPDQDEISDLSDLYLQSGFVFPANYFPIPKSDLSRFADKLASSTENKTVQQNTVLYSLNLNMRDAVYFGIIPTAAFEYNLYTDKGWEDYQRLYWRNEPFSSVFLYLQDDYKFGLGLELKLFKIYEGSGATNLPLPKPGDPVPIDNHYFTKGYLWYNFDPLQIEIGRNQVHEGPLRDVLGLSSGLPFLDMIRVRMPLGFFNLDWIVSTPETRTSGGLGTVVDYETLLAVHRFEFVFQTVKIGIEELNIIYRPENIFFLGDILPVFSFHQGDINPNNVAFVVDADWVIVPGLKVMAQAGFDDINANIIGIGDSGETIDAEIAGLEYSFWNTLFKFTGYLEMGHTHYLWGNFNWAGDNITLNYNRAKAVYYMLTRDNVYSMPLTSPFGPGADWVWLDASFKGIKLNDAGYLNVDAGIELISKTQGVDLTIPYAANTSLANGPKDLTLSVYSSAEWQLFPYLSFKIAPNLFLTTEKTWFECIFSIKVSGNFHS